MTELTAIRDDREFERSLIMIRVARLTAGFGNRRFLQRQTGLFCSRPELLFARFFCLHLLIREGVFRLGQLGFALRKKLGNKLYSSNDE